MAAITILTFVSELTDNEILGQKVETIITGVQKRITPHAVYREFKKEAQVLFLIIGTGGTEKLAYEALEGIPEWTRFFIIAFSGNNSLPAALELRAALEDKTGQGVEVIFTREKQNTDFYIGKIVLKAKQTIRLNQFFRGRLGMIGEPSSWLIASSPDTKKISQYWPLELISISEDKVREKYLNQSQRDVEEELDRFMETWGKKADSVDHISQEELLKAIRLYLTLKQVVTEEGLLGFTIRCFDWLTDLEVGACLALSLLISDSITAGCEGDLPSLITMLFLQNVTGGELPFMANLSSVNDNEIILAHCTVPLAICSSYTLTTHFETGLSIGVRGRISRGEQVIIGRIGGKNLTQAQWFRGIVVKNVERDDICRTAVKIVLEPPYPALLKEALANHYVLVKGTEEMLDEVKSCWEWIRNLLDKRSP
ncbi:MAG: hypothetical protein ACFFD4_22105 [Candidatus Odinarchaeota archaeon]